MNPFEQLVCKEVWAEYKLGQVLQLDSSLHLKAIIVIGIIFCSKWSVRPWFLQSGEEKTFQIAWKHTGVTGCQRTHVHIHMQVHRLTEKVHVHKHTHTVTNKHRSMQKTQMSAAFFICSAIILLSFFSLFICIFSSQSFLALAPDCNRQKWPPILKSQIWPMVVQFSTAWIRTVQLLGLAWFWTVLACLSLRPG